ncbi:hypothetical protein [Sulfurimonas sp.]
MEINISRQNIYLLSISIILFIFVLVFSFSFLIPEGKEYRLKRAEFKKESSELRQYENFRDEVSQKLSELRSENRHIITAFDRDFDPQRFEQTHKDYFKSLLIAPKVQVVDEDGFNVYEVNTTSQINSPKSFYDFLDAVNKSDWIISINFPIEFKREGEMIRSNFTMKVYNNQNDSNSSVSVVE